MRLGKQSRLRVETLEDRSLPSADFVFQWNDLLLDVQRVRAQGNPQSARALAIMGAAVYDSVNAIDPTHEVFHVDARAFPEAHHRLGRRGRGAGGPRRRLRALHPAGGAPALRRAAHDPTGRGPRRPGRGRRHRPGAVRRRGDAGLAGERRVGRRGAVHAGDRPGRLAADPAPNPTPPPAELPGLPASSPQWPHVTPFALTGGDQFRPGPPPALTDADYTEAYREVKALGGDGTTTPTTRTPEQTEIAHYWAGLGVSNAGVAIWNRIAATAAAAHDLTLAENARLFAQLNVANADAFIASYDAKYAYNFWRPVTAIRAADTDGNPDTARGPDLDAADPDAEPPLLRVEPLGPEPGRGRGAGGLLRHRPRELHGDGGGRDHALVRRVHGRGEGGGQEPGLRRHPLELRLRRRGGAGPEGRPVRRGPLLPASDGCGWRTSGRGRRAGERTRGAARCSRRRPRAARRQAAGVDTPAPHGVDVRIADPWVGLPGKPPAGSPGRTTPRPRGAGSPLPRPSRFPGSPRPALGVSQAGWTGPPPRFTWSVLRPAEATGGRSS